MKFPVTPSLDLDLLDFWRLFCISTTLTRYCTFTMRLTIFKSRISHSTNQFDVCFLWQGGLMEYFPHTSSIAFEGQLTSNRVGRCGKIRWLKCPDVMEAEMGRDL